MSLAKSIAGVGAGDETAARALNGWHTAWIPIAPSPNKASARRNALKRFCTSNKMHERRRNVKPKTGLSESISLCHKGLDTSTRSMLDTRDHGELAAPEGGAK